MRRVFGMVFIVMMALLLAACGGDDDENEPRSEGPGNTEDNETVVEPTVPAETHETQIALEATSVGAEVATGPATAEATFEASPGAEVATGTEASPMASPMTGATPETSVAAASPVTAVVSEASPVASPMASPVASPMASPVTTASPEASPAAIASPESNARISAATPRVAASPVTSTPAAIAVIASPVAGASPVASPVASPTAAMSLKGRVELAGAENRAWTMSGEGCVGLGSNADLGVGRQVVIRDEAGVIIGVTTLEASGESDACVWTFTVDVPDADYYAVSIPMVMELVFGHNEIEKNGGEVTIILR